MAHSANDSVPKIKGTPPVKDGIWRRMIVAPEGKILIAGIDTVCLYMAVIVLTRPWAEFLQSLLSMTGTHIIGGRIAEMAWGYAHELDAWVIVVANMCIEKFVVLLLYPLFVFSCHRPIVIEPLKKTMARARRVAESPFHM